MARINQKECLMVTSPYSWGGGVKAMIDEAQKLLELIGYRCELAYPDFRGVWPDFDKYPFVHHFGWGYKLGRMARKYRYNLGVVATAHSAMGLAMSGKPFGMWVATTYADELESKYASALGDEPARKLRQSRWKWKILEEMEKYVLRKCQSVLALSDYTASRIEDLVPDVEGRVSVMNFPIATDVFSPNKKKALRKKKTLIYTGRLVDPRKNVIFLLRVVDEVRKVFPEVELVLVGDEERHSIRPMVEQMNMSKNVRLMTTQPRREVAKLLREADIYIAAPVQEGLGISILEAMACGLPVVITNCGGPESIVKSSGGGEIIAGGEKEFAKKVRELLGSGGKRKEMSRAGVRFIQKHFSCEAVGRQLKEVLERQVFVEGDGNAVV